MNNTIDFDTLMKGLTKTWNEMTKGKSPAPDVKIRVGQAVWDSLKDNLIANTRYVESSAPVTTDYVEPPPLAFKSSKVYLDTSLPPTASIMSYAKD